MFVTCRIQFVILFIQWLTLVLAQSDGRLYQFAFSNDGFPANFVKNGRVTGQSVDMVMEICKFHKKKCRSALVQRGQCWQSLKGYPPFSAVLNGRWFDSCSNLPSSPEREFSYAFPKEPFLRSAYPSLIVAQNSKITLNNLLECHNLTLAYPANTAVEPDCLLERGYYVKPDRYRPVDVEGDLITNMAAIADLVAKRKVDLGITITRFLSDRLKGIKTLAVLPCVQEVQTGLNNMMRADDEEFMNWWDFAVKRFICSGKRYQDFCKSLELKYNVDPLCREPGKDIDCKKYGGPGINSNTTDTQNRRINPCIIEECEDVVKLTTGDKFFQLSDADNRNPWKALEGSGDQYKGLNTQDVVFTITANNEEVYRMDRVCLTVIFIRSLKFLFKGGEREADEIDVPIENEKVWSTHCARLQGFRKFTRIELRWIGDSSIRLQQKIRVKNLFLLGCV